MTFLCQPLQVLIEIHPSMENFDDFKRLDGRRRSELVAGLEAALAQSVGGLPATASGDAER